jgi:MFS family permease
VAIAAVFFVNGCTFSSWSPRLPELQEHLGISDGALGLTLVGMGIGGLAASSISGRLVDRCGSRTVTVATSLALSVGLPLLGVAPAAGVVFAVLIVLGALDGLTDVAMNSQGVELQQLTGRSILSRFHALWSLGAVTGGLVASRAATAGVPLGLHLSIVAVVLVVTTAWAGRRLLPDRRHAHAHVETDEPAGPRARAVLPALVAIGVAIALVEMPPNDWAALLMASRFDIAEGTAALGYVAVAGGMLTGRLVGDHVADALGVERTRRGGALLAAMGIVIATTAPVAPLAGLGLGITGLGLSSLFPLAFRAASDLRSHAGMAAFSTGARMGILVASPLVGLIANSTSIATAVLVVSGTAGLVVALARLPRPSPPGSIGL